MTAPKFAFLCGSLRKDSINQKLQTALIKKFEQAGVSCSVIDLGAYNLPIFHGDLDVPSGLKQFVSDLSKHDGIVVVSPEYNGGLPPILKNAIDWISTHDTTPFKNCYWGIASCTPGPMSGIMGMRQINYILMRVGSHVSPFQVGVGNADTAFDKAGNLVAETSLPLVDKLITDMLINISR